jgi:hypothetical protein
MSTSIGMQTVNALPYYMADMGGNVYYVIQRRVGWVYATGLGPDSNALAPFHQTLELRCSHRLEGDKRGHETGETGEGQAPSTCKPSRAKSPLQLCRPLRLLKRRVCAGSVSRGTNEAHTGPDSQQPQL